MNEPSIQTENNDPFRGGLVEYARRLRCGELTIVGSIEYCLQRIDRLNPKLQAFQSLDPDAARASAQALDKLLQSGTDLGPLMGVSIGIKDIMACNGFPTTNGSLFSMAVPGESDGPIVARLRQAGCIVLGKTKTVEFALGATGVNEARGTPWNPWDLVDHRMPGGSSSGSAVSVAAGFTGFALGTDTGGSVRIPACYNGLFGHKTTVGLWSTDGVFPLSPTLDSIGPICRNASDAAIVHSVICNSPKPEVTTTTASDLTGLKLGIPVDLFLDDLDDEVTHCFNASIDRLRSAGATIMECELPEAHEKNTVFPAIVPAELIHTLTPQGFESAYDAMDSVTRDRASFGLSIKAHEYVGALQRHRELVQVATQRMAGLDGWISPTCPFVPMTIESLGRPEDHSRSLLSSKNTQPGNLMGLCASSLPIQQLGDAQFSGLPIGLQLMMPGGADAALLSVSQALQNTLGEGNLPALEI